MFLRRIFFEEGSLEGGNSWTKEVLNEGSFGKGGLGKGRFCIEFLESLGA